MIDNNGFRYNIGIILTNDKQQVLLAKRIGQAAWQFPQGGIDSEETWIEALYRELYEEVGLNSDAVKIIGQTKKWLRYKVPYNVNKNRKTNYIGQKQRWFLLKFLGEEQQINLNTTNKPEFDAWQWVSYWYPLRKVIFFKRSVYRRALTELAPYFWNKSSVTDLSDKLDPLC